MRYRFTARSAEGETKSGYLEALDPTDARLQLEKRKLQLLQLAPEESAAPVHITAKAEPVASAQPKPPSQTASLWAQVDRGKLVLFLVSLTVLTSGLLWLFKLFFGQKTYRIQLTGHLALISKQELEEGYMDRVQLGLRIQQPPWQVNRDGTIGAKGNDGRYQRIDKRAKVTFDANVEGDYRFDAEVSLPQAPTSLVFFVEAPGFSPRWAEVKLSPGKDGDSLTGSLQPMTIKRLKRRPSLVGGASPTPAPAAAPSLPKYDPDAPEPSE